MTTILKPVALSVCVVAMMCAADVPKAPFNLGFVREAVAGLVVAPVRRTAVVTTAVVASSSANANAAAAANANAAAANASAAAAASKPPPAAAPGGPPPVGTMVTALPPGCAQVKLNDVDYMRCGSTYYKASMMGTNLVFVVAQP
jgi:hypothetical protein